MFKSNNSGSLKPRFIGMSKVNLAGFNGPDMAYDKNKKPLVPVNPNIKKSK